MAQCTKIFTNVSTSLKELLTQNKHLFDTFDILLKVTVQFIDINFSSTHQVQYSYFYDQHSQFNNKDSIKTQ